MTGEQRNEDDYGHDADDKLKEVGDHDRNRENAQWDADLVDQAAVGDDRRERLARRLGEERHDDEAHEHREDVVEDRVPVIRSESGPKDQRVDAGHDQGVREGPEDTEKRPAVPG